MENTDKLALVQDDPWLEPYTQDLNERLDRYKASLKDIVSAEGSLVNFGGGHKYYGINFDKEKNGWYYREWAPGAHQLSLMGDFNGWNKEANKLHRNEKGDWEIFLPYEEYKDRFTHQSKIKVHVISDKGGVDRIPAYITRVLQNPETHDFSGQLWFPEKSFQWTDNGFSSEAALNEPYIYEAHTGMAQEKEGVGSYREFADNTLQRIKDLGYNTIQLMAVMEHPYYGSFGYHVSNFFAPASRFGTPEDLKYLVNKAHGMGLTMIMDIVHSHAVKNIAEGINEFDGTDHQYFHPGGRGYHSGWDSKL
ncbi:MAG TPA: alpha-amylase family glycosyl hydrolase, partial [Cytophagaceae bacterium]|nr:alpha-amylase family glycosyl hydrolase [Cytophagaceae bacterium]